MSQNNIITRLVDKIAYYSKMDDNQKNILYLDIYKGFILNLLADGSKFVSTDIINKLNLVYQDKSSSILDKQTILNTYIKQLIETKEGKEVVNVNVLKVAEVLIAPISNQLTDFQKDELQNILQYK